MPQAYEADISVTITQVMALRSARNAGLSVPKETIERAITYVRQCQNPGDGGFRYMLSSGGSAYPRSGAGVASLQYAGIYEDDAVTDGLGVVAHCRRVTVFGERMPVEYLQHECRCEKAYSLIRQGPLRGTAHSFAGVSEGIGVETSIAI